MVATSFTISDLMQVTVPDLIAKARQLEQEQPTIAQKIMETEQESHRTTEEDLPFKLNLKTNTVTVQNK
jgi:hypothetical protein